MPNRRTARPSIARAGIMLGIGLGGLIDGILLHQILQLHNMLSARIPPDSMAAMRTNMTADGLFHLVTWLATLIGVALLWRALAQPHERRPSAAAFAGTMLAGWGWFNLIEGLVAHHVLGLHHVVEALGVSLWDWLFVASGAVLIIGGHWLARRAADNSRTLD
jgi:uncharacterized membrane protein